MGDLIGNICSCSGSSRPPHSRQPSNSDEQNILHFLAPLPCEFHPYLSADDSSQNIRVQCMHPCPSQVTTQPDSDILHRPPMFDHGGPTVAVPPIAYPESSQRITSHALSPHATDASRFNGISTCDLATLHIGDTPLHGSHTLRRGSWPSHSQGGYSTWIHSLPRIARSPVSEPPESTSDESFQDSDVEEEIQMSPMLNQFQIHSPQSVGLSPHHMYSELALQPSVMTFQLSEKMLQPANDPENRQSLCRLLETSMIANDKSEVMHSPASSSFFSSSATPLGGVRLQGPSMRLQHDSGERLTRKSPRRVPEASSSTPFPSPHSPTNARVSDQRASGSKQKKSKMHQCEQCKKMFPRPSGLKTHMNSHSGAKPHHCPVDNCDKSFAVRSNMKRHMRTHGINPPSPDVLSVPRFTVGFEKPMVTQVHDAGRQPSRYRWIIQEPSTHENDRSRQGLSSLTMVGDLRTGLTFQTSMSSGTSSTLSNGSDDDREEIVPSSVVDVHQYRCDYNRGAVEFSGSYPNYEEHT